MAKKTTREKSLALGITTEEINSHARKLMRDAISHDRFQFRGQSYSVYVDYENHLKPAFTAFDKHKPVGQQRVNHDWEESWNMVLDLAERRLIDSRERDHLLNNLEAFFD